MAPCLDKVMAVECSKSTNTTDQAHSWIQALFLDTVGPLTELLDGINKGQELAIDVMEGAVKAALSLTGSASSHCNALKRTTVLEKYNKDLVSFAQGSDLFTSATMMLFGPSLEVYMKLPFNLFTSTVGGIGQPFWTILVLISNTQNH